MSRPQRTPEQRKQHAIEQRAYRLTHREGLRAYASKWAKANSERLNAKSRARAARIRDLRPPKPAPSPELIAAQKARKAATQKIRYAAKREQLLAYASAYRATHPRDKNKQQARDKDKQAASARARYAARWEMFYGSGACIDCGSTKNLEYDHRDPSTKLANVSSLLTKSLARLKAEVDKCDLRCLLCHRQKARLQRWGRTEPVTIEEQRAKSLAHYYQNRDRILAEHKVAYAADPQKFLARVRASQEKRALQLA